MTNYPYAVALIIPAADQTDANKLAVALGHDEWPGATFRAPLSSDGTEPATHFGALSQATNGALVSLLNTAKQDGTLPSINWADYELTATRVAEVLAAMTYAIGPNEAGNSQAVMADAMAQAGVTKIVIDAL